MVRLQMSPKDKVEDWFRIRDVVNGKVEIFSRAFENFRSRIEKVKDLPWGDVDSSSSGRIDREGVGGWHFKRFVLQQPIIFIHD